MRSRNTRNKNSKQQAFLISSRALKTREMKEYLCLKVLHQKDNTMYHSIYTALFNCCNFPCEAVVNSHVFPKVLYYVSLETNFKYILCLLNVDTFTYTVAEHCPTDMKIDIFRTIQKEKQQ